MGLFSFGLVMIAVVTMASVAIPGWVVTADAMSAGDPVAASPAPSVNAPEGAVPW
jgi:hypothetical protein